MQRAEIQLDLLSLRSLLSRNGGFRWAHDGACPGNKKPTSRWVAQFSHRDVAHGRSHQPQGGLRETPFPLKLLAVPPNKRNPADQDTVIEREHWLDAIQSPQTFINLQGFWRWHIAFAIGILMFLRLRLSHEAPRSDRSAISKLRTLKSS